MVKAVKLTRFKKYKDQGFELNPNGVTLLVGGNNSGKSTLIHALSVWEFCKMILLHEKGRKAFNQDDFHKVEGFGMSAEEFLPVAVPSLNHLWTNLKTQLSSTEKENWPDAYPGYIMRIKCIWDYQEQLNRMLEIGLSLSNDRLFIRVTDSNLTCNDHLLSLAYLPTFAGILPKENKATIAERRAYLGRGMAGSVIRNMVYELYSKEQSIKEELLKGKKHLSRSDRKILRQKSPFEKLQNSLRKTFLSELEVEPFSEDFHTVLKIYERKVTKDEDGKLSTLPKNKYTPRDIITQGSGYLQWLNILCVMYSPDIDVVLLDEPDAHLHASLQGELLGLLQNSDENQNKKQVLVSTHSVEIIRKASLDIIFSMDTRKYLCEEASRVSALAGIGSEYFPQLDKLQQYKKLIFVENESDRLLLSILGQKCDIALPENIAYWANTYSHAERSHIFYELRKSIPNLKCISLRDRDRDEPAHIGNSLEYHGISPSPDGSIVFLEWKRKNIESYLLCPRAIAAASGNTVEEVTQYMQNTFALAIENGGCVVFDAPPAIIELDGKHHFMAKDIGIYHTFHCDKYDVAQNMNAEEVCQDIKIFLEKVHTFFNINE